MASHRSLLMLLLLAGCVGRQMASSFTAASPAPAPDVFACARGQLKAVQFDQTSYDLTDYRLTARKYDETVRRPDVTWRRLVDRLEVTVAPGAGADSVSVLSVVARTFGETVNQRGPTETQEATSETARSAAQRIVDKCRAPVDSASVPG
ncbi:MAG: hypothetical protein ACJ8BF_09505 [Gemmatimonadales bacterium]